MKPVRTVWHTAGPVEVTADAIGEMLRDRPHHEGVTPSIRSLSGGVAVMAVSIVAGITLAVAIAYFPLLFGRILVIAGTGCSLLTHVAMTRVRRLEHDLDTRPLSADEVLVYQGRAFRMWFARHSLPWGTLALGVSLFAWHAWGAWPVGLALMAAGMSCGLFPIVGAITLAPVRNLGLCWSVGCPRPRFHSLRTTVREAGMVMVLHERLRYAAECDSAATEGRLLDHLFAAKQLIEAGHTAHSVLFLSPTADPRVMAMRERVGRACVLGPFLILAFLIAWIPLSQLDLPPLPPLSSVFWLERSTASVSAQDEGRGQPEGQGQGQSQGQGQGQGQSRNQSERSGSTKDSGRSQGQGREQRAGQGQGPGQGRGQGQGQNQEQGLKQGEGQGPGPGQSQGQGQGQGQGRAAAEGRGQGEAAGKGAGGGQGLSGPPPQRASTPAQLPPLPRNPGAVIDVPLPPLVRTADGTGNARPPSGERAPVPNPGGPDYRPQASRPSPENEALKGDPVQRWPNWIYELLHRQTR